MNAALVVNIVGNMAQLQAALKQGQDAINVTTAGLTKMANSFNADSLIMRANAAVAAIDKVGISTLTAAQAGKQLNILDEAMEKLEATGRPVPLLMQQTADGLQSIVDANAPSAFEKLSGSILETAQGFALGQLGLSGFEEGLRTLVSIAQEPFKLAEFAAQSGEAISDLSLKTGIAVGPLSVLAAAVTAAGGNFESLGNEVFMLDRRMQTNGADVEKALTALGISVTDFNAMSTDQRILALSDGFRSLSPEVSKAAVGYELFGKQAKDAIVVLQKPLSDLTEQSKALGLEWTAGEAASAEEFSIKSRQLQEVLDRLQSKIGEGLLPGLTSLASELENNRDLVTALNLAAAGIGVSFTVGFALARQEAKDFAGGFASLLGGIPGIGPSAKAAMESATDVAAAAWTQAGYHDINLPNESKGPQAPGLGVKPGKPAVDDWTQAIDSVQKRMDALSLWTEQNQINAAGEYVRQIGGASALSAPQLDALAQMMTKATAAGAVLDSTLQPIKDGLDAAAIANLHLTTGINTHVESVLKQIPAYTDVTAAVKSSWAQQFATQQMYTDEITSLDEDEAEGRVRADAIARAADEALAAAHRQMLAGIESDTARAIESLAQGWTSFGQNVTSMFSQRIGSSVSTSITSALGDNIGSSLLAGLATGGIGLALGALPGLISGLFHRNAGQDEIDDWAKSTFGSESQIHIQLEALGAQGSTLWAELLNVPKGDKAAADQAISDITAALKTFNDTAAFQRTTDWADQLFGSKTQAALQQTADDAVRAYNLMLTSGKYSADQLAAAWQKVVDAQNDLTGISGIDSTFGVKSRDEMQLTAQTLKTTYDEMVASGKYSTDQLAAAWQKVTDAQHAAMGVDQFGVSSSFANVQSLVQKYNLTSADGDLAYKQNQAMETGGQLGQDFASLTQGGIWGGSVANSMKDQIQSIVSLGVELPASIKEAVTDLIGEGALTGANGSVLTDVNQLTFQADPASQFADLTKSTDTAAQSATDLAAALGIGADGGGKSLNQGLIEATGNVGDLVNALAGLSGYGSSQTTIPMMDAPIHSVTSPGLVRVNPGDIVGMPHLTPGFSGGGSMSISVGELHIHAPTDNPQELARVLLPALAVEAKGRRWS